MASQRERRKRRSDRRDRSDDDRVVRLEDQGQDQDQDRGRKDHDYEDQGRESRGQEGRDRDWQGREQGEDEGYDRQSGRPEPLPALEILDAAKDQLTVLTGRVPDSVSGLRRSDNGWRLKLDMVELERIPPSTSVMATYEVELDRDGNVVGYEQERRFVRGQAED